MAVNENNIAETIRKGSTITKDAADAAQERIEKDRKDQLASEARSAILESEFKQKRAYLELKKNRDLEVPTKAKLAALTEITDKVKAGTITTNEVETLREEAEKAYRKAANEIIKDHKTLYTQLCDEYPGSWQWRS